MRVLLNDASSYSGRSLVEALQKQGHTVIALTNPGEGDLPTTINESFEFEPFKQPFIDTVLGCDAVVMQLEGHTKTSADVLQVLVESELHKDKIFIGVSNLMTWCGTAPLKPKRKLPIGGGEGDAPADEEAPLEDEGEDADNPDRKEPLEAGAVTEADWPRRTAGETFSHMEKYQKMGVILPPDPDYEGLMNCEKLIARSRKQGLATYIVNHGLCYGRGERDAMAIRFKDAWELKPVLSPWDPTLKPPTKEELAAVDAIVKGNAAKREAAAEAGEEYDVANDLPVPALRGRGDNMVPTIHVDDMAMIVASLAAVYPYPETPYILAVDRGRCSLKAMLTALSKNLGNGELLDMDEKSTCQTPQVEKMQMDLVVQQSQTLKSLLKWNKWKCRAGPIAHMELVLEEFRKARKVTPLKIFLHGPPGRGSTIADALSKHYKIRCLNTKAVIAEALELEPKKFGKAMRRAAKKTQRRLPDRIICEMYRRVIMTQSCKNQGYILDGFPKTFMQAKWLTTGWKPHEPAEDEETPPPEADLDFAHGYTRAKSEEEDGGDEEAEEEETPPEDPEEDEEAKEKRLAKALDKINIGCTAEYVFLVECSMREVEKIASIIPETTLIKGHDDEEGIERRLKLFQSANATSDTAVAAYEDAKIAGRLVTFTTLSQDGKDVAQMLNETIAVIGEPHNYGLTEEELNAIREANEAKEKAEADAIAKVKAIHDLEEAKKKAEKIAAEEARKDQIASMDESTLLRAAMPLRKYLQANVMATIRRALIECAEVRPNDPIDYIAEYLLENNMVVE